MAIAVGALGLMAACGGGDKGKMKKMKEAMCACKDAACVDKVQKDYADFMKSMEEKYKGDKKPDEDMMKIGEEMAKCMSDAMAGGAGGASDTGAGSASASGAGSASASGSAAASGSDTASGSAAASGGTASADTGVPECDDYLKAFDKYMSCDKIPQQAKDASKSGIEQMKQGWAMLKDPNVPAEAKKAAGDACKQAVDALKQSASAMGCAL
ncbi:MAG TPA: hypothetical protein VL463_08685 [Kofleriaceae bacterium]|nr:hypothetical protein [Kofleriaceae bacterium]